MYRERHREKINQRKRETRQRIKQQQIQKERNINNIDAIQQNMEGTPNNQQSLNSLNDEETQNES